MSYMEAKPLNLQHWRPIKANRYPSYPHGAEAEMKRWLREAVAWETLANNGEHVMPALFVGEPGCGKTSMAADMAERIGLDGWVTMGADVVASHMGETGVNLRAAFAEMNRGLFLIDEFESIAGVRGSDGSAGRELGSALTVLLDCIDNARSDSVLVFATNRVDMIDIAILRRVTVIKWPSWEALSPIEQHAFAVSHCGSGDFASYAECVKKCRRNRIEKILSKLANGHGSRERQ